MKSIIKVRSLSDEQKHLIYNQITMSEKVSCLTQQEKSIFTTIASHHFLGQNRDQSSIEALAKKKWFTYFNNQNSP